VRESREAEERLRQLLAQADERLGPVTQLATELTARIHRAKTASKRAPAQPYQTPTQEPATDAGIEFGRLKYFQKAIDFDALEMLDRDISQAVVDVLRLREECRKLGVSNTVTSA
jgi:hypothetical protein